MSTRNIAQLVDGAPLVLCLGPGGVGKTTLSSVIALHQAAVGNRSLVLTVDPARRLADALGVAGLTNDPVEVSSFARILAGGSLSALMLDPTATFDHLISILVSDPARREGLLNNRFYQAMSRSLAGTLEYMAVERLYALVTSGNYDSIVLDTPPTTNALDFIEAPERLSSFFSEKVTRWFMPADPRKKGSWTSRLFDRAGASALHLLERVGGEDFVRDTSAFFGAFADLLGNFRARGLEVGKLLRDPRTVFLIVCAPDVNRVAEAKQIDQRLSQAGCRAHGFVVNRVNQPFLPANGELEEALAKATTLLGGEIEGPRVRTFLEKLETLRKAQESSAASHARLVEELRTYAAGRPVFTAPSVPAGQSPRASLLALYVGLFADSATASAHAAVAADRTPPIDSPRRRTTDGHEGQA